MDKSSFLSLETIQFLVLVLLPLIFKQFRNISSPSPKSQHLPPGPRPWPIIGNIHQMGKKPHVSLANLARVHGPLISLRLGAQLLVVASSPMAATEILKTHDRLFSGRKIPKATPCDPEVLDRVAIVWTTECTDQWKHLRALCRTELFSAKAIESQAILREKKVTEMVEVLGAREGDIVNIGEVVFATVFNILGNLLFSRDVISYEEEGIGTGLKRLVWKMLELGASPNIADFYPMLARCDLQGLKWKVRRCVHQMFKTWESDIKRRRETQVQDSRKVDFLDVFIANGFDDQKINWLFLELFIAGTDTTSSTVEWAMAELMKNKDAMKRVRQELRTEINEDPLKETHASQLPYLKACVKETLRLHPPAPFLIPRCAAETCEVMNHTIPKNSQVIVNVWAIGRDPTVWEDPLSFRPERFLGTSLDFKGQNFGLLPFGGGRRICPGVPMAARQVPLILAALIQSFDWSLPNGEDPANLDMNDKFGITLQKQQPLLLVPKRLHFHNLL
ncbi:hypothetical protein K2173_026602 [Erythroxylum novogranatense]|uniref:(S)-N-methylcoclaurine 3'-hydroxylase isozyme 2 n=1 Tax=Erythroxylum novogranatense TaxID=1862640 RepID=A0AAV8TZ16_9ROSI|nr:hypothetical protein K2173_026602 [Erythroxylum novogranatense]